MKRFLPFFAAAVCFLISLQITTLIQPQPDKTHNKKSGRSGALEALELWTASRAYPFNDIPANKYAREYLESKRKLKEISRSPFANYEWQFIGPVNLSGRTIALALNPINGNTLYAGSASGGLWRSYTGGVGGNWERITTGYPVLGVNSIAIDPTDTNTIYIGTGEVYRYWASLGGTVVRTTRGSYGMGILKTTDNGQTWTKSLDWSYNQQEGVQVVRINPQNPKSLWAGTTAGVLKSTDGGLTWEDPFTLPFPIMDLLISPVDTNKILASSGNFGYLSGVYLSTDNGEIWDGTTLPSCTGKIMLGTSANNPNTVYASIADSTTGVGSLWRSDDFGFSWDQAPNVGGSFGVQGWYSHYVAVHPNSGDIIVHGGVTIAKSTNAGESFSGSSNTYSDHHAYAIHPLDPNILYDANDDGVYRSTNFGASFTKVSDGYNTGQFYNGFSNSTTDSLLSIGQVQDHIPGYKYTGSLSWSRSAIDEVGWTAITPGNDNIMFAVYRGGGSVYRSTNRGAGFSSVASFGGLGAWSSPIAVSQSSTNYVYFAKDKVYRSTNSGESGTWIATNSNAVLDGNPSLSIAVAPSNANYVYVGTAPSVTRPNIWKTTTAGLVWQNVTGNLPSRYPNDIAVDPTNTEIVYVALGGFSAGHFFKSTTGGTTWIDITGSLPDVPGTAVMVDPLNANNIFAGNDIGVYISTDGGASWNSFSDGLPDAVLVSDVTYSASNRTLRVATHGNGIFERKLPDSFPAVSLIAPNGGEAWEGVSTQTIQWTPLLTGTLKLEYSLDDGTNWTTIVDNLPPSPSSYAWDVPFEVTTTARVGVSSTSNSLISDVSDSAFTLYFNGAGLSTTAGWDIISLPVRAYTPEVSSLFTNAISYAFGFNGSYVQQSSLSVGNGYWLKFGTSETIPIKGDTLVMDTVALVEGWNLVGSLTAPVSVASVTSQPENIFESEFFGYSRGYEIASTIEPGKGYWIKTNAGGQMIISSSVAPPKRNTFATLEQHWNRLTLNDKDGSAQTLYFGKQIQAIEQRKLELPPPPPSGIFDARFSSHRMLEVVRQENAVNKFPISIHSATFPLTVSWEVFADNTGWLLVTNKKTVPINGSGSLVLSNTTEAESIVLAYDESQTNLPLQTRLLQNYPNPFNPVTVIGYQLSANSYVTMKVYDVQGREVVTLVDEFQAAGFKSQVFDASVLPSGIYVYKLTADNVVESRKMLLVK